MADWLNRIAERRMLAAGAQGRLTHLPGEGRPLPERPGDASDDMQDAAGDRVIEGVEADSVFPRRGDLPDAAEAAMPRMTPEAVEEARRNFMLG